MTPRFVLDAWAVLAFLQKEEPAAGRIRQLLEEAALEQTQLFISIINLSEVFYRIGKIKGEASALDTLDQIRRLRISVLPASDEAVWAAARFKMLHPISYADAFALSSAQELKATLITGDPEFIPLGHHFQIEQLHRY